MGKFKLEFVYNKRGSNKVLFCGDSFYTDNKMDKIKITNRVIEIEGSRTNSQDVESVLQNVQSTIYKQFLKTIVYTYLTSGKKFNIDYLKIVCGRNEKIYNKDDIINPCKKELKKELCLKPDKAKLIFKNKNGTKDMLVAMILFVKGAQNDDFEYLWKTFNALYSYISSSDKEHGKLRDMRVFVETNADLFVRIQETVDRKSEIDIRELRIRDFILNNFDTRAKTGAYAEMVESFTDYRLNIVFNEIMPYRRDYLIAENKFNDVDAHIKNSMAAKKKNNIDLIRFYILKYAYFLRNKYFHAEKSSPIFVLKRNNEIVELEIMTDILARFLADLLDCADLYVK